MESGKYSRTKPKTNKENSSVICCTYTLNQHLKISAKKIWIVYFYLAFGHAVRQYKVTLGANISLEIQHECGNNIFCALI